MAPRELHELFSKSGVNFFTGVPDSILGPFINYLEANEKNHVIAVNEGSAVALGIGHYLGTVSVPLVYLQNSGLGNALDPLVSVADPSVMGIPMILLIGWRGQPDTRDEPQHVQLGAVTEKLLDLLEIKHVVLDPESALSQIQTATEAAFSSSRPYAMLVKAGTFAQYPSKPGANGISREEAVKLIADNLSPQDVVVATNGKIGRELFEHRHRRGTSHKSDLLVVGGMGHASVIALQIALEKPKLNVYCLDGDGSVLMHLGSLAQIGSAGAPNFTHIVLNNRSHESTGGQSTIAIHIAATAKSLGYRSVASVETREKLIKALGTIETRPRMIEVLVSKSSRADLMRPTVSPSDNKTEFMKFLKEASG